MVAKNTVLIVVVNCLQFIILVADDTHVFVLAYGLFTELSAKLFSISLMIAFGAADNFINISAHSSNLISHHLILLPH